MGDMFLISQSKQTEWIVLLLITTVSLKSCFLAVDEQITSRKPELIFITATGCLTWGILTVENIILVLLNPRCKVSFHQISLSWLLNNVLKTMMNGVEICGIGSCRIWISVLHMCFVSDPVKQIKLLQTAFGSLGCKPATVGVNKKLRTLL